MAGLIDHFAVVPEGKFCTVNCLVPEGATVMVDGVTLVGGAGVAVRVKLAVPRTACVEEFVAVTVIAVCVATVVGAVYRPLAAIPPVAGLTDHATVTPEGRFCTENCCVPEGATVTVAGITLGDGGGVAVRVKVAVQAQLERKSSSPRQ